MSLFRIKLVKLSALQQLQAQQPANISDINRDKEFMALYKKIKNYTLVEIERCFALYQAVKYILTNNVEGDFVECGVWKGGSCMLIAEILKAANISNRQIYLYDTFEGMVRPGEEDGEFEKQEWEKLKTENEKSNWCLSSVDEAKTNMELTGYPLANFHFIKGMVEETIPATVPLSIALLRLDTDWYASTRHELIHLYPLLTKKGILIIDDYGAWPGAKKAVDEYFKEQGIFMHRLDFTGRLIVK